LIRYISIFKSTIDLCVGFALSRLKPIDDVYCVIASNYGERVDPNASILADYFDAKSRGVIFISNDINKRRKVEIKRGTINAAYYFFCCHTCFYTHSLSDVIPYAHKLFLLKKIVRFPKLIFLQHGVIGLKSMLNNGVSMKSYIQSLEPTFDKMIVSSSTEASIVEKFGIPSHKLAITGLPRFDAYHREVIVKKTALVFFTWQASSSLHAKYKLIEESGIQERLSAEGYKVVSTNHDMQEDSSGKDIRADQFQEAIMTCSLLITDDSSLAWDILYRQQHVVFLSPSNKWLVKEPDLLKCCCYTKEELAERIVDIISYQNISKPFQFAEFYDNNNCERVAALSYKND